MYRSIGLSFLNLLPPPSRLSIGGRYPAHIYVSIILYSLDAALLGDSFRQFLPYYEYGSIPCSLIRTFPCTYMYINPHQQIWELLRNAPEHYIACWSIKVAVAWVLDYGAFHNSCFISVTLWRATETAEVALHNDTLIAALLVVCSVPLITQ